MRISDWSSDVCSSDLVAGGGARRAGIEHGWPGQRVEIDCGFRRRTLPGAGRLARNVAHRVHAAVHGGKIGSASCRARVCQKGSISVVAVSLKKNNKYNIKSDIWTTNQKI